MWALSLLILTGCDSQESATQTAWNELQKYCQSQHVDCSKAKMDESQRDGFGWFFDFVISTKPEHLVAMKIGPLGHFELWRSKED